MNKKPIASVKGTRDFYPRQMAFRRWFYTQIKEVSQSFGFEEYDGPIIESLDLYAAKSGQELVKKQAFTLQDRSGKTLALRPEMTPTLARMIAQKTNRLTFPVKWFNFGRRFRYEKPQKGRGREFFQWDIDILGANSPQADAQAISIAGAAYQKFGLTPKEAKIKINDRQLLQGQLRSLSIPQEQMGEVFRIIDKKEKVGEKNFLAMLKEAGLSKKQTSSLSKLLTNKNLYKSSPRLTEIFRLMEKTDLSGFIEFDPTIVRGLDYYTGVVFEGRDTKGKFRSILGGGRYDNLTQAVGGKVNIPGVGFAMGNEVVESLLESLGKLPVLKPNQTKVLATVFSSELEEKTTLIAARLRQAGIQTDVYLNPQAKLDKQLKYADRKQIPWAVIIGPEEIGKNVVTLKNMQTKTQKKLTVEKAIGKILKPIKPFSPPCPQL